MPKKAASKKAASERRSPGKKKPASRQARSGTPTTVHTLSDAHRRILDVWRTTPGMLQLEAYLAVYPNGTRRAAHANAYKVFNAPAARDYLRERDSEALARANVKHERIIREIADLAFLDPIDFVDDEGNVRSLSDMPPDARRAIAGIKVRTQKAPDGSETVTREVKFADKNSALDKLMRHAGLYKDTTGDLPVLVLRNLTGDRSRDPDPA